MPGAGASVSRTISFCQTRFAVAALRRAEPELRGAPLVLARAGRISGADMPVLDLSEEAERRGVRRTMTLAQALAVGGDEGPAILVRPLDAAVLRSAKRALIEVARSVAPRVEPDPLTPDGVQFIHLDGAGLERIFGSMGGVAAALSARVERVGFSGGVGVADSLETAAVAAERAAIQGGEVVLVPTGRDREWLAPLPLSVLRPAPEAGALLRELGVHHVGELAALSRDEIATRLGREGLRLRAMASGEGCRELRAVAPSEECIEAVRPDWGVDSLEALLFLLRGVLDRVVRRLEVRGWAVAGMELRLSLAEGGHVTLDVGVQAPTRETGTLLRLLRHALEKEPPPAAVNEVALRVREGRSREVQMDLFRPAGPPPERLGVMLSRVASLCGEGRVGRPVAATGHRFEAIGMAPFAPSGSPRSERPGPPAAHLPRPAALRVSRPALPLRVKTLEGRPRHIVGGGFSSDVDACAGPWRVDAEWWQELPCRRDYFDVELRDGGFLRIFKELQPASKGEGWFLEGVYD